MSNPTPGLDFYRKEYPKSDNYMSGVYIVPAIFDVHLKNKYDVAYVGQSDHIHSRLSGHNTLGYAYDQSNNIYIPVSMDYIRVRLESRLIKELDPALNYQRPSYKKFKLDKFNLNPENSLPDLEKQYQQIFSLIPTEVLLRIIGKMEISLIKYPYAYYTHFLKSLMLIASENVDVQNKINPYFLKQCLQFAETLCIDNRKFFMDGVWELSDAVVHQIKLKRIRNQMSAWRFNMQTHHQDWNSPKVIGIAYGFNADNLVKQLVKPYAHENGLFYKGSHWSLQHIALKEDQYVFLGYENVEIH